MTRISKIKPTKKGRHALFCGDDFLFSVDEQTLIDYEIGVGSEFSDAQLRELRERSELSKARQKALLLLGVREHAEKELYDKLLQKYDEPTARYAVDEMLRIGYLDDMSYARNCRTYIFERKNTSRREAENYLWRRGVEQGVVEMVLEGYGEDEVSRIAELIQAKYLEKAKTRAGLKAVYGALLRKGFSSADIRAALQSLELGGTFYEESI